LDSYDFLYELKVNDFDYEENNGIFLFKVANTIIQQTITPLNLINEDLSEFKNMSDEKILLYHMMWELKYVINLTKLELKPEYEFKSINDRLFLFWNLDISKVGIKKGLEFLESRYLTTKIDNNIIVFNASILKTTDKNKIIEILNHITNSFIIKNSLIKAKDLKKLLKK